MVEFALVLPLLLVMLLGIADFARVFTAGITVEAAARDGAEAAALERLRIGQPSTPGDPAYYQRLHKIAAQVACAESRVLPETTYVPDNLSTPAIDEEACPNMPVIAVCVRDGDDPDCGGLAWGTPVSVPSPGCDRLMDPWDWTSGGEVGSHSVEVRMCYRFKTLFNLDLRLGLGWGMSLGDVYLVRSRTFLVDCPPGTVAADSC